MNIKNNVTVNREYKSTVFAMLYQDKKELLHLYNALNYSNYTDEEELEIVTLENAVYMAMKNDMAFILDCKLHLYEHQSTPNYNMPLRDLFYVSQEYQKLVNKRSLYSSKKVLKLSDLYEQLEKNPMLELQVLMLNINEGNNQELKDRCHSLGEYMQYVEKIRYYVKKEKLSLQEAVESSVTECIKEGILADFLGRNRAEAIAMSIFEYDEEKELRLLREAEYEAGREDGLEAGLKAMVCILKKTLPDIASVYEAVVAETVYSNVTMEEIEKYYNA